MNKCKPNKDKKFCIIHKGKKISFGAKGYRIKPGTKSGNSYCARSFGIKDKTGKPTRNNIAKANYWSRLKWKCKGKKSIA